MSLVDEILEWPSFTGVQLDFLQKKYVVWYFHPEGGEA